MKSSSLFPAVAFALVLATAIPSSVALAAQSVPSERSKTAPVLLAPQWRNEAFPSRSTTRLQYREIAVSRILKVQQYNESRRAKPAQIGIGRAASSEGVSARLPALKWVAMRDGGSVARIEIGSPVALGIRVGLQAGTLDPRVELRFAGSDEPARIVSMMTGAEIQKLADARGIFWTPGTDGERQIIELYLPARVSRNSVKVQAPELSHLLANSSNDFKIIEKIGESGSCNVDTACRVAELGPNFVSAKNAVAHMVFTYSTGVSYICTGTLLADTVAATQIPYFYSANHCFAGGSDGVPAQNFQTVANTLNTYWKYEATSCGSGVQAAKVLLSGGADYLYSNATTDAMLLRLKNAPPAGSELAGWDSAALAPSSPIIGIHHPSGDVKKVSLGQQISSDSALIAVGWLSGTTEGGSSGSGLFTTDPGGYRLRGGLYGGNAACSNSGSLGNSLNRDYYSRFDVAFPNISQWLSPLSGAPIRMNDSHPLTHSGASPVAASAPSASAAPVMPAADRTIRRRVRTDQRER
ncbi:MAG: trypsin-like serine peptidase [Pseudoxanthomonas sp.]